MGEYLNSGLGWDRSLGEEMNRKGTKDRSMGGDWQEPDGGKKQ